MKLKILFTSDLHGYFFPTDYIHTGCRPMGVNALSGMFRAARDENTLTIDGGDTLQGSPFAYYAAHHGRVPLLAQAMNDAGYDYVTVGNHDFNYGYDVLSGYLNALNAKALAANVEDLGGEMPLLQTDVRAAERAARGRRGRGDGLGEPLGKAREPCEAARERHAFGGAKGV